MVTMESSLHRFCFSPVNFYDKCQSYLYTNIGNRQRIKTFEAFCEAAKFYPQAACIWLDRLGNISADDTLRLFKRVPENRISPIAVEFAQSILTHNRDRLLNFRKQI